MKRYSLAAALLAAVALFVSVPVLQAADSRILGQVVDPKCSVEKPADPCNVTGAQAGHPMALRGKDGTVYTIIGAYAVGHNAKLLPFVGKSVTVTGTVTIVGADRTVDIKTIK
jgi:hypothetical protein